MPKKQPSINYTSRDFASIREDLEAYVITQFVDDYRHAPDIFEETWDDFKDSFEWSEELRDSIEEDCANPKCCRGACKK